MSDLKKSIIYTLAYFSVQGRALTQFELWRHLFWKGEKEEMPTLLAVQEALLDPELGQKVIFHNGFYALKGDEDLLVKRDWRQKNSIAQIKKIYSWSRLLALVPYVRGIFVTGTLSFKNAGPDSDWDILLVVREGRIWLGRLLFNIILELVGKRRHGKKISRRFCINHYLAENGLILEEHNEYSANFVTFSFPIYGGDLHRKFVELNRHWYRKFKPCFFKERLKSPFEIEEGKIFMLKNILEFILEKSGVAFLLNNLSKKIMLEKIKNNPLTKKEGADIRCADNHLIFLPDPHRQTVSKMVEQKLTKLL